MTLAPPPHHAVASHLERDLSMGRSFYARHRQRSLRTGGDVHKRLHRCRELFGPAAVSGTEEEAREALVGIARSVSAHLSLIRAPELPVTLDVGAQRHALTGPRSHDMLYLSDWLDGFHAALALRDPVALGLLLAVPDDLWADGREAPVWRQTLDFLRGLYLGRADGDPAARAVGLRDAARELNADGRGIAAADLVPLLDAWSVVLGGGFLPGALVDGLSAHARFWPSVEEVDRPRGYVALWLLGVTARAWDLGLRTALDTPYLPRAFVRGAAPSTVIACPYCVTPMDPDTEQCGGCFEDPRCDAPIELDLDEAWIRKASCPHCAYPLHHLAVRCGRCAAPL